MTKHMMIDLETFGVGKRSLIVQIGWSIFSLDGEYVPQVHMQQAQFNINTDSCKRLGGVADDSTLRWWLHPDREAARASLLEGDVHTIERVLDLYLRDTWRWHNCSTVWARGSTFDIALLEGYYEAMGTNPPWAYNSPRDTRTLEHAAKFLGWSPTPRKVAHNALQDALDQVEDLKSAWNWLVGGPQTISAGNGVVVTNAGSITTVTTGGTVDLSRILTPRE